VCEREREVQGQFSGNHCSPNYRPTQMRKIGLPKKIQNFPKPIRIHFFM
jgi:hypothetical protein